MVTLPHRHPTLEASQDLFLFSLTPRVQSDSHHSQLSVQQAISLGNFTQGRRGQGLTCQPQREVSHNPKVRLEPRTRPPPACTIPACPGKCPAPSSLSTVSFLLASAQSFQIVGFSVHFTVQVVFFKYYAKTLSPISMFRVHQWDLLHCSYF